MSFSFARRCYRFHFDFAEKNVTYTKLRLHFLLTFSFHFITFVFKGTEITNILLASPENS